MELKVTSEKVKAAAASCPEAKEVLTKLFPEVFEGLCGTLVINKTSKGVIITGAASKIIANNYPHAQSYTHPITVVDLVSGSTSTYPTHEDLFWQLG